MITVLAKRPRSDIAQLPEGRYWLFTLLVYLVGWDMKTEQEPVEDSMNVRELNPEILNLY